ncbi:MAG: ABC-type transport system, ATPase component, partial [Promethearchaeota archaeon CR_4]
MNAIQVENLSKIFVDKKQKKEIHAVDGITFSVAPGEIFGFLGPNGAGKTTTIRILAGLLKPNAGRAWVLDHDVVEEAQEVRKTIGFLTENHGNYENLTLEQNLAFFASFYGIEGHDAQLHITEIIDRLGLEDRRKQKVGKFSKGLKQRAALARVLIHNPSVLFFDEPTSGLDPVAAVQVRELILGLKARHRTIFINSHNLEEVQKVCDRVAIIDAGKLKRIG